MKNKYLRNLKQTYCKLSPKALYLLKKRLKMNFLVGDEAKVFEIVSSLKDSKNQFTINWANLALELNKSAVLVRNIAFRLREKKYFKPLKVTGGRNKLSTYEINNELEKEHLNFKNEFSKKNLLHQYPTSEKTVKQSTKEILKKTNLYFISNEKETMVKIGISDNVDKRLRQHQTSSLGEKLKIMRVINNIPAALEKEIHEEFKHLRKEGEWFLLKKELKMYIEYMRIPECLLFGNEYR